MATATGPGAARPGALKPELAEKLAALAEVTDRLPPFGAAGPGGSRRKLRGITLSVAWNLYFSAPVVNI